MRLLPKKAYNLVTFWLPRDALKRKLNETKTILTKYSHIALKTSSSVANTDATPYNYLNF